MFFQHWRKPLSDHQPPLFAPPVPQGGRGSSVMMPELANLISNLGRHSGGGEGNDSPGALEERYGYLI